MVSQRGIKANPEKIRAVLEMQSPSNHQATAIAAIDRTRRHHKQMLAFLQNFEKGLHLGGRVWRSFPTVEELPFQPPNLEQDYWRRTALFIPSSFSKRSAQP